MNIDRFDRQTRIRGWNQRRLQESRVAVYGRDWLGTFTVWALASLGIGEIVWLGRPCPATETMANWFLADPCPFSGCRIYDYPLEVEYGPELAWAIGERGVDILVCGAEDSSAQVTSRAFARDSKTKTKFLAGTTARGGWYGSGVPPHFEPKGQEPVAGMALAAMLADSVRETLCPLSDGSLPPEGPLRLQTPEPLRPGTAVLVGVGGIGVYVATLISILGYGLYAVDFDQIEAHNLNRQGIFTPADVQAQTHKAIAACTRLKRLFPKARVRAEVRRVEAGFQSTLAQISPSLLLSAVDNAPTRLLLQSLAREMELPLVQGGTDIFAADCFTQERWGALLDEQMHGALADAASKESRQPPRDGCAANPAYVVPGMMAGALMAYRMVQICELYRGLLPIRWRSGSLPVEQRSMTDGFDFAGLIA